MFEAVAFIVIAGIVVSIIAMQSRKGARQLAESRAKQEALFQASFPELQPHFHPEKVLEFVKARRARARPVVGTSWKKPPGFAAAAVAEIAADPKGEAVRLLDEAGALLARFVFQEHPEGGVIRMGPGKFTVNLRDAAVRYWHPEREFKWSRLKGWRVITAMSDRAIDSNDRGTSFSSSSDGPSVGSTAAAAAAGAAVTGAGGAFDGGGSSGDWGGDSGESRTSY